MPYLILRDLPLGSGSEVLLHGPEAQVAALHLEKAGIKLPRTFQAVELNRMTSMSLSGDAGRVVAKVIQRLETGRAVSVELRPIEGSAVLAAAAAAKKRES